jgi:hypothetical protein
MTDYLPEKALIVALAAIAVIILIVWLTQ